MYKVVISIYGKTRPAVTVTADDPTVAVLKALDKLKISVTADYSVLTIIPYVA